MAIKFQSCGAAMMDTDLWDRFLMDFPVVVRILLYILRESLSWNFRYVIILIAGSYVIVSIRLIVVFRLGSADMFYLLPDSL